MPRFCAFCLFCLALFGAPQAHAHPHEWIDVTSTPVFDAQGQITAIREHWLFDIYYTALSLPDFDANHNKKLDPEELLTLADDNLRNLKYYSYFTYLEADGKPVSFVKASDISSTLEDGRIGMKFTITPKTPLNPHTHKINYRIYDPSYYVSMQHVKKDPIQLEGGGTCRYDLMRPEPNAVWINLAKSLDKNATAPEDLGKYFAERVTITCP
jgi:ABC-type uncharacterized transport system substrate-binding protein